MGFRDPRWTGLAALLSCLVIACAGGNGDDTGDVTDGGTADAGTIDGGDGGTDGGTTDGGSADGGTSGSFEWCVSGATANSSGSKAIIDNGDFSNSTTGWSAFGPGTFTVQSDVARSGSAAMVAGRTATWNGLAQTITGELVAGQILEVTAWVRIAGASSATVKATIKTTFSDGEGADYKSAVVTANDTGWTRLTGNLSIGKTNPVSSVDFYFEGPDAGVTIYVDDVVGMVSAPGGTGTGDVGGGATVVIDPATTFQTLEGFGAAVGWGGSSLTGHSKASELYALLFKDLGLDILRLRNRYDRKSTADEDEGKDGRWKSLIANEDVKIFNGAKAVLGHAPLVLLTSWSPPGTLKASGYERCDDDKANNATTCTLAKVNGAFVYADFGKWWADSIAYYSSTGITPDLISIQNEPNFVPTGNPGWEGCKFMPTETTDFPGYGKALAAVHAALPSSHPRVLGPEVVGVHWSNVQNYAAGLDASLLDGWATHLYELGPEENPVWDWRSPGPDSFVSHMKGAASVSGGKPIFATEFSTNEDNGIEGGFETAWLVHDAVAEAGFSSFLYWDLVWDKNGGLVTINDTTNYAIRDQYYAMRHFSRFTDPGDKRILASSNLAAVRVSAWAAKDGGHITLVLLNTSTTEQAVKLSGCDQKYVAKEAYRTIFNPGSSTRWEDIAAVVNGTVTLPARSVATVVLYK